MTSKKSRKTSPSPGPIRARFFASGEAFRRWLLGQHGQAREVWVGFYRKDSGKRGITYSEALDAALCFGWIDGIRKKLDDTSYVNRFTPRKPNSIWSTVNIRHVERLTAAGLMHAAGLAAFSKRDPAKSGIYSFEQRPKAFPPQHEAVFKAVPAAWAHFNEQPPGYQRLGIWFVMSAKREETQSRRLQLLLEAHARSQRMGVLFGQTGATAKARARTPRAASRKPRARRR